MLQGIERQTRAGLNREAAISAGTAWDVVDRNGQPMYRCASKGAALGMLTKRSIRYGWTVQPARV